MSKHTPGPWEVLQGPAGWIQTVGSPYGHGQMHVADARGWGHLTGTGACHFSQEKAAEIQDANAALIAAAPEMLAALKAIAYEPQGPADATHEHVLNAVMAVAREAIAKAEGK